MEFERLYLLWKLRRVFGWLVMGKVALWEGVGNVVVVVVVDGNG
jgi:hypothetical protein